MASDGRLIDMEFFAPARSLYRKAGFSVCDPFGTYRRGSEQRVHDARPVSAHVSYSV